jgi:hypothetical protein
LQNFRFYGKINLEYFDAVFNNRAQLLTGRI